MFELIESIEQQAPWLLPSFYFVAGGCVGSFLNVCIHRIPAEESIVRPRSHCSCGAPIPWFDNFPIVSWFVLRGRASCCGARFSIRYPAIELLTALLFLACWELSAPPKALLGMLFSSLMVCAAFIDFDHMVIPDRFTIGGFVLGVLLAATVPSLHGYEAGYFVLDSFRSFLAALVGAFIGSALLLWTALTSELVLRREVMGFGDVKLMGAIGAFCGWQGAVFAMFGGAVIGTLGVCLYIPLSYLVETLAAKAGGSREEKEEAAKPILSESRDGDDGSGSTLETATLIGRRVPFAPMMALAAILYFIVLNDAVDAYFASVEMLFF